MKWFTPDKITPTTHKERKLTETEKSLLLIAESVNRHNKGSRVSVSFNNGYEIDIKEEAK